jgi:hypothetical protein
LTKQQQLELLDVQIAELAHVFIVNNLSFENREQAITEFMLHLNDHEFMTATRMMFINAVAHNSGVITNMDGRVVRFAVLSVFDKHLQRAYAREMALRPFFTWALCAFVWWLPSKHVPWTLKALYSLAVMVFWGFEYPRPLTAFRSGLLGMFDDEDQAFIKHRAQDFFAGLAIRVLARKGRLDWCPEIFAVLPWIFAVAQSQVKTGSSIRSMRGFRTFFSYLLLVVLVGAAFTDSWFAFISVWVVFLWDIVVTGLAFGVYGVITGATIASAVVLSVRETPDAMRVARWCAGICLVLFLFTGMSLLWVVVGIICLACGLPDEHVQTCLAVAENKVWPAARVVLIIAQQLFGHTKIVWVLLTKDAALAGSYVVFVAKQLGKLAGFR